MRRPEGGDAHKGPGDLMSGTGGSVCWSRGVDIWKGGSMHKRERKVERMQSTKSIGQRITTGVLSCTDALAVEISPPRTSVRLPTGLYLGRWVDCSGMRRG